MHKILNILGLALAVAALVGWITFQARVTAADARLYSESEVPITTDPWTAPFIIPSVGIGF